MWHSILCVRDWNPKLYRDFQHHIMQFLVLKKSRTKDHLLTMSANLKYHRHKCLCQRYWLKGVYGTSKQLKFYRNDFKHDLYCCTCCWFEMSAKNPFEHTVPPHPSEFWTFRCLWYSLKEWQTGEKFFDRITICVPPRRKL